jgi:hypothetical protein
MSCAQKRNIFLAPLLLAAAISYTGAFLLRFEFVLPHSVEGIFYRGLPIYILVKCFAWWAFRVHANTWRFAGLFDLNRLMKSTEVTQLTRPSCDWPSSLRRSDLCATNRC